MQPIALQQPVEVAVSPPAPAAPGAPIRRCLINATTDEQAIAFYLQEHARSPGTREAYEREVGRFWLWCRRNGIQSFNAMGAEMAAQYRDELRAGRAPTPREVRESGDATGRTPGRRREATDRSTNYAIGILRAMFGFLFEVGYLGGNVFAAVKNLRETVVTGTVERYLRAEDWEELQKTVAAMDRHTPRARGVYHQTRWVIALAVIAGLRRVEIATGWMGSFRNEDGRWWLHVLGKGAKQAKVPVPVELVAELRVYRAWLRTLKGFEALPDLPGGAGDITGLPLVGRLDGTLKQLDVKRIWEIVHRVVEKTAERLAEDGQEERAAVMALVSTHWLRHTGVTAVANLADVQTAKKYARHSNVKTTMGYVHTEDEAVHDKVSAALRESKLFGGAATPDGVTVVQGA